MCILFVYTLLKVVSNYDLSVLSMSVMGSQKKVWWVDGVSSIQFYFGMFLPLRSPLRSRRLGAIQVLRNAVKGGRVSDFPEKNVRRCTVQRY